MYKVVDTVALLLWAIFLHKSLSVGNSPLTDFKRDFNVADDEEEPRQDEKPVVANVENGNVENGNVENGNVEKEKTRPKKAKKKTNRKRSWNDDDENDKSVASSESTFCHSLQCLRSAVPFDALLTMI